MTIFGVNWDELDLERVETFLAGAGDEGLTWEAKGTTRPRPGAIRKAVCGFANAIGGYLIVGAEQGDGEWSVLGVDFEGAEPKLWLAQQIRDGLRPPPIFDVHAWEKDGRAVAVVRVDAAAVPPCMTIDGHVYERVSGATVPVTDPAVLARLSERGQLAERHAEAAAQVRAEQLVDNAPGAEAFLQVGFVLAPTGLPDDLGSSLFAESFSERATEIITHLPIEPLLSEPIRVIGGVERLVWPRVAQDHVRLETAPAEGGLRHRWTVRASWDGAVGVMLLAIPDPETSFLEDPFFDAIRPLSAAAVELVKALGGFGRSHIVLRVFAARCSLRPNNRPQIIYELSPAQALAPIRDWTQDDGRISDEAFGRMRRQLLRGLGVEA